MRKILTVLGGLFLVLIVAGAGMAAYAMMRGAKADAEAKSYLALTAPAMLAHPTAENLTSFMAREDKAKIDPAALNELSSYMSLNLGGFQSCGAWSGGWYVNEAPGGETVTANYRARCQFAKASLNVLLAVKKSAEVWSVVGIHLDGASLQKSDVQGQGI